MAVHRVSSTHGIMDANPTVLVPLPAHKWPTCGRNVRISDKKPLPINVKCHSEMHGSLNPFALGSDVFRRPFEKIEARGWNPNEAKVSGNRFDHLVALYARGYEISGENPRTMRRIAAAAAKL